MLKQLYHSSAKNAKKRGIAFNLDREDFAALWHSSDCRCAVTGRLFDLAGDLRGEWRRNPWAPSVDRIRSADGYKADNCRLVCVAVNLAMNEWGLDVLREVAHCLFGSAPGPELSRSGSGCMRGVSKRTTAVGIRFVVRVQVAPGKLKEFGSFRDYEQAVRRLSEVRPLHGFRSSIGVAQTAGERNGRKTHSKSTA